MRNRSHVLVLAAGLMLAFATTALAERLTEQFDKTWTVKPGARLVLSNENGIVQVTSWDRPAVRIEAEKTIKGHGDNAREAMKALRIEVRQEGDTLVVETRKPNGSGGEGFLHWLAGSHVEYEVSYRVTVPSNFNVEVETVNGRVEAENLSGELSFGTTNGPIDLNNLKGSVSASTTNGSIHAELVEVTNGKDMSFTTTNGRIGVVLPANFRGDVDAGTTNGSIDTDFPVTSTHFSRTRVSGTINGGGRLLRLRTTNGGITIRKQ